MCSRDRGTGVDTNCAATHTHGHWVVTSERANPHTLTCFVAAELRLAVFAMATVFFKQESVRQ